MVDLDGIWVCLRVRESGSGKERERKTNASVETGGSLASSRVVASFNIYRRLDYGLLR